MVDVEMLSARHAERDVNSAVGSYIGAYELVLIEEARSYEQGAATILVVCVVQLLAMGL
jgi:hypothetical protein